ncbi:arginine N-succinyltransferase [uncultured Sphingomonas sp.]|uniref:arginine N-succinyltransferase n=1 Tax=uncultured Sphingomonas sp. TaxID=158754 RepID=UPI0025F816BD|nr:arginine N-succinyltransferase [uncultured Sphingomonas sp.]
MTIVLRAAGGHDLSALYDMALTTGGGFVNLPPDRAKLGDRLAAADAAFARDTDAFGVDRFLFVLEDLASGAIDGTCQIFSHIGTDAPFYSYRIDRHGADHAVLGRSVDHTTLTICTDHAGCSEVGGLFLRADARAGGAGTLLARSRYLFIAMHRARFADRTIAELRGVVDDAGEAPFWDGIAARFFGMGFAAADAFNADHGTHVLAGLLPTTPILLAMLPESARAVLGVPHPSGRPALRLLEKEGFRHDDYVDLFDGGPTVTAATDAIATVRHAQTATVRAVDEHPHAAPHIAAAGRLAGFRACFASIAPQDDGIVLDPQAARALNVGIGDPITYAPR